MDTAQGMSVADLKARSKALTEQINKLCEERLQIDTTVAQAVCHFKVGQRIRNVHNGRILHVSAVAPGDRQDFVVVAYRVLKSGKLGVRSVRVWSWDLGRYAAVEQEAQPSVGA